MIRFEASVTVILNFGVSWCQPTLSGGVPPLIFSLYLSRTQNSLRNGPLLSTVMEFLYIHSWPAYSPSLSSIKHRWNMLDQAVNWREVQSTNLKQLKVAFSKEWVNISKRSNIKLMKSMPSQVDAVINAHQHSTWNRIFLCFTHVDYGALSWICQKKFSFLLYCHALFYEFLVKLIHFPRPQFQP